ncbi:hypothetical protein BALAC2494_02073 [Bifidobacterium animalis subsp. lactis CNCM I-2494]|uniref:Uncharacterized protein n=1 Tax=Bifidobacterium animalis subsp. lactis CNCM I-2494 TaxID=1042403 RepID=A0A806FQJ7_BIFAN|nr:hypothetical protein BALAC2494_02073 [Bifidobacterium animalis subsp. lactis CNCM I-2494]
MVTSTRHAHLIRVLLVKTSRKWASLGFHLAERIEY